MDAKLFCIEMVLFDATIRCIFPSNADKGHPNHHKSARLKDGETICSRYAPGLLEQPSKYLKITGTLYNDKQPLNQRIVMGFLGQWSMICVFPACSLNRDGSQAPAGQDSAEALGDVLRASARPAATPRPRVQGWQTPDHGEQGGEKAGHLRSRSERPMDQQGCFSSRDRA